MVRSMVGATSIDLGPALTQIGIGVLIAAPAWLTSRVLWLKCEKLSDQNSQLREDQISRERELSTTAVPVLGECVRALTAVAKATEEEVMMRRVEEQLAKRGGAS